MITSADLFLPTEVSVYGWPMVADAFARGRPRASVLGWIQEALTASLSSAALDLLISACRAGPLAEAKIPAGYGAAMTELAPLLDRLSDAGDPLAALLREALAELPASPASLDLMERAGDPAHAIREAAMVGHRRRALAMLERYGGMHLPHLAGADLAGDIHDAIGEGPEPLVASLGFMVAVKKGDTARAQHLLSKWGGPRLVDFSRPVPFSDDVPVELLVARGLLAVYGNVPDRAARLGELYDLLARLPTEANLMRGAIHNVALSFYIDAGSFAEAEVSGERALANYADAPYLCFYVHLHRAIMRVIEGHADKARPELAAAEDCLAQTPFETPQDDRFLSLLRAVVAYEHGDPHPMADFAQREFANFSHGEIWPNIADQAMAHGADALLELSGLSAALDYLESWRQKGWRTRRFRVLIEQRRVAVLQTAQRWREARMLLDEMAGRIGRIWIDSSGENLRYLAAPEDITKALLWLRQQCYETPRAPAIPERLAALSENRALSWRNRQCVQIWQAWVARRRSELPLARRLLAEVIASCTARQVHAPLIEERIFVLPLLDDARMKAGPMKDIELPRGLRRRPARRTPEGDLSAQERRALLLLAEGCANKDIAREMGVSLPTVKFHLKNLYRKLGAANRREAVSRAVAAKLISP
ncbi:helix-turn-helix transcriptional regulator [Pseudooceanicola marinus]|uniref:helix-turn-helix transcriptional regulator n=1 Tax=Pseudooceanicola marinus TaxID=396013 RepID=UPI001CD2BC27|nr:helix-turn-helix transcriptional regulator [Pseudooceanicola marinus]MCA1338018.1 helix-turn-helix transcriptional regulator [Pseudooceanicola marinus]